MNFRHYVLATAGHVDHGKSALVKALTGTDPDRLPEEKERGITIDLGFACLDLPAGAQETFRLGIVDVPGHEDFVKNMVAGVGSVDLALLIVAADDAWMPQTEEHLQILEYLEVRHAAVALTKIDLAPELESDLIGLIRRRLAGTFIEQAPVIPTSVQDGRGIPELKDALRTLLSRIPPARNYGKARLPVDRVFTLRGIGTVVTGTQTGGDFHKGQPVVIQPGGRAARIRTLQNHQSEIELSHPGARTAMNLPDVESVHSSGDAIQRGEVVSLPGLGQPRDTLDVLLEKSPRLAQAKTPAAKPLKDGALVRLHLATANIPVRVKFAQAQPLAPGEKKPAQLRAETPIYAFAGDRFILRDWPEENTLAGGVVLDPDASRKKWHSEARREFLEARAGAVDDPSVFITSQLRRDRAARADELLLKSRFSREDIESALERLVQAGAVVAVEPWVVHAPWWRTVLEQGAAAVDAEHHTNPDSPGLALNTLRALLERNTPAPELVNLALAALARSGYEQAGPVLRSRRHRQALPPNLQEAGNELRRVLAGKPLEPPSRKELAPDPRRQQALRFLIQTGEAVELGAEVVIAAQTYSDLKELVTKWIREKGPATVSQLRQAAGASRRIIVPLLERLDREGVTRRQGDIRVLRT